MDREEQATITEVLHLFRIRADLMIMLAHLQEAQNFDEEVYHWLSGIRDTIDPFKPIKQLLADKANQPQ